jgi:hypothetical protein
MGRDLSSEVSGRIVADLERSVARWLASKWQSFCLSYEQVGHSTNSGLAFLRSGSFFGITKVKRGIL